eukprot:m.183995 g.183995  ORF g.183995 m.183995 type:complete len:90 (+) comp39315_c0_seq24:73-342(+)
MRGQTRSNSSPFGGQRRSLGVKECVQILLTIGADVTAHNAMKYNGFNEAVGTEIGDCVLLQCRDFRLGVESAQVIPQLMERLQEVSAFN